MSEHEHPIPEGDEHLVETTDEDGKVHYFEPIEELEVDGARYALLIYRGMADGEGSIVKEVESNNGHGHDEEVVLMRVQYDDDGAVFEAIEDDAEFQKVLDYIDTLEDEEEDEDDLS